MKPLLILMALAFSPVLFGQEYDAIGVEDSAYIFQDQDKKGNLIGEPAFLAGCSWYCGGDVQSVRASSSLADTKKNSYAAINAHDFDFKTAWVEGVKGYGIGEYLEYRFNFDHMKDYGGTLGINKLIIANGYKKSKSTWENNARVKQMILYVDGKKVAMINLLDQFELQTVTIEPIYFPENKVTTLKFEISDVYAGKKYEDTAMSLLMFEGLGVH
ncbi:MAG: hypothetical protein AAFP76_13510 [Bacteroidota bacterium]